MIAFCLSEWISQHAAAKGLTFHAGLRGNPARIRIGLRNGEAFGSAGTKSMQVPRFLLSYILRLYIHFQCVLIVCSTIHTFPDVQNPPLP